MGFGHLEIHVCGNRGDEGGIHFDAGRRERAGIPFQPGPGIFEVLRTIDEGDPSPSETQEVFHRVLRSSLIIDCHIGHPAGVIPLTATDHRNLSGDFPEDWTGHGVHADQPAGLGPPEEGKEPVHRSGIQQVLADQKMVAMPLGVNARCLDDRGIERVLQCRDIENKEIVSGKRLEVDRRHVDSLFPESGNHLAAHAGRDRSRPVDDPGNGGDRDA